MAVSEEYRSFGRVATQEWQRAIQAKELPACCHNPIGLDYLETLYVGALLKRFSKATEADKADISILGAKSQLLMKWYQTGCPQFNLTVSAAAAFVLTDTTGLRWGDVRFPFDHFLIFMPSPSPVLFDSYDQKELEVHLIQVARCLTPSIPGNEVQLVVEQYERARRAGRSEAELRVIQDHLKEVPTLWVQGDAESGDGVHRYYTKHIDPAQTLGDWCDPEVVGEWQSERSRCAMSLVCRVVACLALYLDHSEGPEKRWDPSLLERNRAKGRETTTWDIGREIKLPRELREAARVLGRADKNPAQWSLQSRMMVRGHWRNQPCGKGRVERRKRFIEPYWRGPEAGELVDRMYKIGSEESLTK